MEHQKIKLSPVPRPEVVVSGDKWRVTVLTARLLRLEYHPAGRFTDGATKTVICRDFPAPEYGVKRLGEGLELDTGELRLFYDGGPFSPEGLRVELTHPIHPFAACWRYGDAPRDLGGTARTLDGADGPVELEGGLMSADGYAVLDDSRSALIAPDMWAEPRDPVGEDIYFFGYGHDYLGCLRDFYRLTGPSPLLPRYALGNWWSRYFPYSERTYMELMDEFRSRGIPLSVAVVDMDWHLTNPPPGCGSGWTGYTWNPELFPDPRRFLEKLHSMGLKVTLNVHPAEGVGAHERAYPDMARAVGVDPESGSRIPFDVTDKRYMEAYFKYLHHPLEEEGVDFWWLDWQQGRFSSVPGIDPLWMLNHLHFLDSGREGRWPMTLSRYAGPGSHRYPIGFSGDSYMTWESLDFQPYFTANASNIGYTWWSHDIGGHQGGRRDDELTARWVELGVFSPIMRLHSTANPFTGKEPWGYGPDAESAIIKFMRLRKRLVPYLYSMNYLTARNGLPLVRPMYYESDCREAYSVPNEYRFGTQMIACPITRPRDPETLLAPFDGWLPEGTFFDLMTGRIYRGGRRIRFHRDLGSIPVLVPAGGIIPLDADGQSNGVGAPETVDLLVYPGADGHFELYEDDGVYGSPPAVTDFELSWGDTSRLTARVRGDASCIPENRVYRVHIMCAAPSGDAGEGWSFDAGRRVLTREVSCGREGFTLTFSAAPKAPDRLEELFTALSRAQIPFSTKTEIYALAQNEPDTARLLYRLSLLDLGPHIYSAVLEFLTDTFS